MKTCFVIALAALTLIACERRAEAPAKVTPLALTCGAPFEANASAASLAAAFGAANVTEETIDGPEGEPVRVTVLFAADPSRRVDVLWSDAAQRSGLLSASMRAPNTVWRGPGDLAVGASLDDVTRVNGGPFDVSGFGWDYGGAVIDWRGGRLAPAPQDPCTVLVQFEPAPESVETTLQNALGDRPFASDSPEMRAVNPRVWRISIGYVPPAASP